MAKKSKIELNRETDFTAIDAELDDALAKLEASSSKVDELLATESGATPSSTAENAASDDHVEDVEDDADESEEE